MVHENNEGLRRMVFVVWLGQLISFVAALAAISSSYLASLGVHAPITQAFFTYMPLTIIYGSINLFRCKKMTIPWYYYVPLGFVDVQGSYFVVKAFQFTSITSVTLFDCWVIPWVMLLTYVFITKYSFRQYIGAATCIFGLVFTVLSDAGVGSGDAIDFYFQGVPTSKPLLGDFYVIVATVFLALSNVGEELFVKQNDIIEVISMLGLSGLLVSICEIALLERHTLESIEWSSSVILGFAGYAVSTVLLYTLIHFLLKLSGSALYSLSTLTSDMWAIVIRILFYREEVGLLYYVSFAIVALGLIIYAISEKNSSAVSVMDEHPRDQYEELADEFTEIGDATAVA